MKTAVITGSSRGIGKSIAEEFAQNGYHIVINAAKSKEELEETYNEFIQKGYSCSAVIADVSDYSECSKLFSYGVDVLINNAGVSYVGLFNEMSPQDWRRILDINLNSVFNCTHYAVKEMLKYILNMGRQRRFLRGRLLCFQGRNKRVYKGHG